MEDIYHEMTALTEMDIFCKEHFDKTGEYMSIPTAEEIKTLLSMWGKLDRIMTIENLEESLDKGKYGELIGLFSWEHLFFEEGKDVSILTANRYYKMMEHSHDYFEIEFVVEGTAIHNPGKEQIYLQKGDVVLIPPKQIHNTQPVADATIVDLEIRLSTFETTFHDILAGQFSISYYFKNALYGENQGNNIILEGVIDDTVMDILSLIWKEGNNSSYVSGKKCAHLTEAMLYHLAEVVTKEHVFHVYEFRNELMYQIRRYIIAHLETVTLAELAEQFHRSTPAISKYIKKRSGKGFAELLQNMRLERAAELLLTTDMDVKQIGFAVGYAGESHFIFLFRKKYKTTPLQYRRLRKKDKMYWT